MKRFIQSLSLIKVMEQQQSDLSPEEKEDFIKSLNKLKHHMKQERRKEICFKWLCCFSCPCCS